MSASPEPIHRADDQIVTLLSQWLVGQLGNDALRKGVEDVGTSELAPGQREAVGELLDELRVALPGERADLQVVVRETLESLAYGD
ncbi:MAG TPA: hypothetical protein VGU02_05480 [Gaiellaceae bacterium]|nr:hypothetical protein [Gaiellaceae bacterium]